MENETSIPLEFVKDRATLISELEIHAHHMLKYALDGEEGIEFTFNQEGAISVSSAILQLTALMKNEKKS